KRGIMKLHNWYCLFLVFLLSTSLRAQCPAPSAVNCEVVPNSMLMLSTPGNTDFTFDGFGKYTSGITQGGSTILRLKVLPLNGNCKWMLRVYIDNNPGSGSANNEWEKIYSHSTSGAVPTLDLLQIRVY